MLATPCHRCRDILWNMFFKIHIDVSTCVVRLHVGDNVSVVNLALYSSRNFLLPLGEWYVQVWVAAVAITITSGKCLGCRSGSS